MKETLRIICSLAAVMLISACGGNKTVYVSPDGDDTNPGTVSKPFKTLSHAVEAANAMATPARIILKDGEYPMDGTVEVKGINGLRIEAAKGAAPVLSGEVRLEGWTRAEDANLSEAENRQIRSDLMKDIWVADLHKAGSTILLVEQNAQAALSIADRAYVLETGNIVLTGKASDLLEDERIKKAYLGE